MYSRLTVPQPRWINAASFKSNHVLWIRLIVTPPRFIEICNNAIRSPHNETYKLVIINNVIAPTFSLVNLTNSPNTQNIIDDHTIFRCLDSSYSAKPYVWSGAFANERTMIKKLKIKNKINKFNRKSNQLTRVTTIVSSV